MGFFGANSKGPRISKREQAFNNQKHLIADLGKKKLADVGVLPHGSDDPDIYVLFDSPTESQVDFGLYTKGTTGAMLRQWLGKDLSRNKTRFGAVVREPLRNQYPDDVTLESWRGVIIEDIERTKPKLVVGLGPVPLQLVKGTIDIHKYRGRVFPVKFGNHVCWYMATYSPVFIIQKEHDYFENEHEIITKIDFKKVKSIVNDQLDLGTPEIVTSGYDSNIHWLDGQNSYQDLKKLEDWLHEALTWGPTTLDFEAQNLRPYHDDSALLTAALTHQGKTYAFPLDHPRTWNSKTRKDAVGLFGEYLTQAPRLIAHNLSMEQEWIAYYYGFKLLHQLEWHDTMAMAYLLDSRKGMLSLDALVNLEYGFNLKELSPLDKTNMVAEPLNKVLPYNGMDTKWTEKIADRYLPRLESEGLTDKYEALVAETASLVGMQLKGMPVSQEVLRRQSNRLRGEIKESEQQLKQTKEVKEFKRQFKRDFNYSSPDDCVALFRDILGRKEVETVDKETGKVKYSTDESTLSAIPAKIAPSAPLVLDLRGKNKLKSTYIDPPRILKNPRDKSKGGILYPDGLLHPNYNGMFTATGRLSADDPNAQNYPKRKNKWVREMVCPPEGFRVASLDFGQIEARVFAMLSKDPVFVDALWKGLDVHYDWAVRIADMYPKVLDTIYNKYESQANKLMDKGIKEYDALIKIFRGDVKNQWVFPQFFGAGWRSCGANIHLPDKVAQDLQAEFWAEFEGVKAWQDEVLAKTRELGYVETMGGLRRHHPMSKQENINTPVQGTACEIVKYGLYKLSLKAAVEEDMYLHPNMQIHDDLTFVLPEDDLDHYMQTIAHEMVGVYKDLDYINVPLIIEAEEGPHWAAQEVYGEYASTDFGHVRE